MNTAKQVEIIKELASYDNETIKNCMNYVDASDKTKAKIMKSVEDYRYARETIGKWFGR